MSENNEYWMFTASILFFACYLPDIYANIRNRNANIYNVPEKVLITAGTVCALVYSVKTQNTPLIANYAPLLFLDFVSLSMRFYYAYLTHYQTSPVASPPSKLVVKRPVSPCHKNHILPITTGESNNFLQKLDVGEKIDETHPFDIENCGHITMVTSGHQRR
jgi:uncharacterized protein with PQ loop repeat